jgi:hypothetical protein
VELVTFCVEGYTLITHKEEEEEEEEKEERRGQ